MANLYYATNPLTGAAWSDKTPVYRPDGGGDLAVSMGTYNFLVNPTATDAIRFCKVPANAIVLGGYIAGADLDTGTGALDIDFGWEANGAETANTVGFGNMGAIGGNVVADIIPVAGIWRPLQGVLLTSGWQMFTYETWLSGLVNTAANAGGIGKLSLVVTFTVR
jgi:hypothetical protein